MASVVSVDSLDLILVCCLEEDLDVLTLSVAEPSEPEKYNFNMNLYFLPFRKVEFMSRAFGVLKMERFSANCALKYKNRVEEDSIIPP